MVVAKPYRRTILEKSSLGVVLLSNIVILKDEFVETFSLAWDFEFSLDVFEFDGNLEFFVSWLAQL